MRDVTRLFSLYRECSRNIWNTYFSDQDDAEHAEEIYGQIKRLLFEGIVLSHLDPGQSIHDKRTLVLRVVPRGDQMVVFFRKFDREGDDTYLDRERDFMVKENEITLRFIDYYDYFEGPLKDYQYYLCVALEFPGHPELEGQEALVEIFSGRVIYDAQMFQRER